MKHSDDSSMPGNRVVAITGAHGFLGSRLIQAMEQDQSFKKVLAIDVRKPVRSHKKTQFYEIDLTFPTAGSAIAEAMYRESVDTVIHLAFLSDFTPRAEWAHELESVGTMHVLNACSECKVSRYIHWSLTPCYGARPENPNFLTEVHVLPRFGEWNFLADKVEAEEQVAQFKRENESVQVAVLRTAPMVGPNIDNFITRYLAKPFVPTLMGYDPMVQFLHEDDGVDAFWHVLNRPAEGIYNIVGRGTLPLTTFLKRIGKIPFPLPRVGVLQAAKALWMLQLSNVPSGFWDFLRYPVVAEGKKAAKELGWTAEYDIEDIAESISSKEAQDKGRNLSQERERTAGEGVHGQRFKDMSSREDVIDEFGFDSAFFREVEPILEFFFAKYFRVTTSGFSSIPTDSSGLLVVNHSGVMPLDVVMLLYAIYRDPRIKKHLRVLLEDMVYYFPFLGTMLNRMGGVRACRENAERLLKSNGLVAVFPEGVHGTGKLFKRRYQLQRFGRGGFVKLALKTRVPIIPVAIIGAEESYPMLSKVGWFSRSLDIPFFPITPLFPFFGPFGLTPLPSRWLIRVGAPIHIHEKYGEEDARDRFLINRLTEEVRATIQEMVKESLDERGPVFWGRV